MRNPLFPTAPVHGAIGRIRSAPTGPVLAGLAGCLIAALLLLAIAWPAPLRAGAPADEPANPARAAAQDELLARHDVTDLTFNSLETIDYVAGTLSAPVTGGTFEVAALALEALGYIKGPQAAAKFRAASLPVAPAALQAAAKAVARFRKPCTPQAQHP